MQNIKTPDPKNYLENENILDNHMFSTIKIIQNKFPDVIFGGSISLSAVGLLNRPIADIDCFVSDSGKRNDYLYLRELIKPYYKEPKPKQTKSMHTGVLTDDLDIFFKDQFVQNYMKVSETVNYIDGKIVSRYGGYFNDVKFCVFRVPEEFMLHSIVKVYNTKIKIQNINMCILAKQSFAHKNMKHQKDLQQVHDIINDLI